MDSIKKIIIIQKLQKAEGENITYFQKDRKNPSEIGYNWGCVSNDYWQFKTDNSQERWSNKKKLMEINQYKCINVQTLQSQVQDSVGNEELHEERQGQANNESR